MDALKKAGDSAQIYAEKMQKITLDEIDDFLSRNKNTMPFLKNLALYPATQNLMNDFSEYTYSGNSRSFTGTKKFSDYAKKAYEETYLPYTKDSIFADVLGTGNLTPVTANDLRDKIESFDDSIAGASKGTPTVFRKKIMKYYESALSTLNRTNGVKTLFNWGMNGKRTTEGASQILNGFSNGQFNNIGKSEKDYLLDKMMNFDLSKFMSFEKNSVAPFSDTKLYGTEAGYNATLVRPEEGYTAKLQIEKLSSIVDKFSDMDSSIRELQSSFDSFIDELKNALGNPEENATLNANAFGKTMKDDTIPNSLVPGFKAMLKEITTSDGWPTDVSKA